MMDIVKFLNNFVGLLKKAQNLPEVLLFILLPFLAIFILLIAPVLIVAIFWHKIQMFSQKLQIFYQNVIRQRLAKQLLEVKEKQRNRLIGRIEKIEDAVKARNEIEQLLGAIVQGKMIVPNKNETIDKLQ